ncbi:MAG: sulfotransferase [Cryomorphaceae bacterium]|nr:sulfotransferase [Cryomorphaceae bacterium]
MFGLFKKKKKKSGNLSPSSPSFIIVGAQKSGTSTLYDMLAKHPKVYRNDKKELHFFDFNFNAGKEFYREQLMCPEGMITGEASPFYMYHPAVAARIAQMYPNIKLIFILRDPAERALSHYRMNAERGIEPLSPLMALVTEEDRLLKAMQAGESWDTPDSTYQNFTYKSRGHYETQWMNFTRHFKRQQMFVMRMETLLAQPAECMKALTSFLNLPAHQWKNETLPHENSSSGIQADESFAKEYLHYYFTPHREKLKAWVPLSVGSWNDSTLPPSQMTADDQELPQDEPLDSADQKDLKKES